MGIFWGAYAEGTPQVAWGALTGAVVSTLTGWAMVQKPADGLAGLWGFNGTLVGCAFPTFLGTTWLMWLCLILCAALSTIVRRGFNNVMAPWKVNSLTFPFVFTTWVFLLASRMFAGMPPIGEATPELPGEVVTAFSHGFGNLVTYWLKGISQVFLINDWAPASSSSLRSSSATAGAVCGLPWLRQSRWLWSASSMLPAPTLPTAYTDSRPCLPALP